MYSGVGTGLWRVDFPKFRNIARRPSRTHVSSSLPPFSSSLIWAAAYPRVNLFTCCVGGGNTTFVDDTSLDAGVLPQVAVCQEIGLLFLASCFAELSGTARPRSCMLHHLSLAYIRMTHHEPNRFLVEGFVKVHGTCVSTTMELGFSVSNGGGGNFHRCGSAGVGEV
jgi:hypothetical protein